MIQERGKAKELTFDLKKKSPQDEGLRVFWLFSKLMQSSANSGVYSFGGDLG